MLKCKIAGRIRQVVQLKIRVGRACQGRAAVDAHGDPLYVGNLFVGFSLQAFDDVQKRVLSFSDDRIIDLGNSIQEQLPQAGGADTSEDDRDSSIYVFNDSGDVYPAPSIAVKNGYPDNIGRLFYQYLADFCRSLLFVVPI